MLQHSSPIADDVEDRLEFQLACCCQSQAEKVPARAERPGAGLPPLIYINRIVKICDHGRGLDGRTVARGRRAVGTGGKRYKQGWADEGAGRRASRRPQSSQSRAYRESNYHKAQLGPCPVSPRTQTA